MASLNLWLLAGICLAVGVYGLQEVNWRPKFLGMTSLPHAAFIEMYLSENEGLEYVDRWQLFISTFAASIGPDKVYTMDSPGRFLNNISEWNIELLDKSAYWPNNPDYVPSSVAGFEGVLWTSGFLVPGKKKGKLQVYDTTQNPPRGPFNIASLDENDWSYHHVEWKDMDTDGDLDVLTARFHISLLGALDRELVWFENEEQGFISGWPAHVIATDLADISITTATLTAGGRDYECIIASEFFNQKTSIFWTESENNDWTDLSKVKYRIVSEGKQPFEALVDDFNKDGTPDFMQSEFDKGTGEGFVYAHIVPDDFRTDNFTREVIARGFYPKVQDEGHYMTPGSLKTFYPTAEYASELAPDGKPHKPWVLQSGDDDGCMYILTPVSDDRTDWTYDKNLLIDTMETTVGKIIHGDIDGDGYEEVIAAGYSVGQLFVYTYNLDY